MNKTTKKKKLLKELPDMMKGSITLTGRSCGKASCKRCREGGKHPVYLFAFQTDGKKNIVSIPAKFHGKVEELVGNWHCHKVLIENVTKLNVELIKEGLFEE
ncbi:MAG: hypothetical protein KAJ40_07960 [Alphaproteobacteria bacterium]|nr:hypothetical protein [Alphaproteobacteria bacterium]